MGMLSEVKCARCDRRYSGLRSRCPYCGARRIGRGKYSGENDNSMGKMLIGILVMVVLIGAVIVLLISSGGETDPNADLESPPAAPSSSIPGEEDNFVIEETPSESPPDIIDETPDETPTPVAVVESLTITYSGVKKEDITMYTSDPQLTLSAKVVPDEIEEPVVWISSNSNVFEAVATDTTGRSAKITPMGSGTATLTVTIGDVSAECIIRVRQK